MQTASRKKKLIYSGTLAGLAIAIRVFALNRENVESLYATGLYPYIASFLRFLFGWMPFSLGDFLYAFLAGFLIFRLIQKRKHLILYKQYIPGIKNNALRWLNMFLIVYISFNLLWGLNYDRKGIGYQLNFKREKYSKEELVAMNELLLQQVNNYRPVNTSQYTVPANDSLFSQAIRLYQAASKDYPFLTYRPASIKKSYYGWLGNYLGFSGYYNPFTGEAQVNRSIPAFLQPFVSCHEMAHQLGYAKENEANFAGYLVATGYGDSAFKYSAYLDLFLYANRNLYGNDSLLARGLRNRLTNAVKADLDIVRNFYLQYQNPVEPYIRWAYGKYLQANNQPSGMMSYNEAVADLIAYHKTYGTISGKRN